MKKRKLKPIKFFICLFIFGFILSINAQNDNTFKAGLILGVNACQISGDNLGGFRQAAPIFGVFVNRKIKANASIQLEMYYIGKGSRKNADFEKEDFTSYRLYINYIEVPLVYIWQYKEKLAFEGGISTGALLSYTEKDENGELDALYSEQEKFKRFDFSYLFGINYRLSSKWTFGVRFSNSLLPARENFGGAKFRLNRGQYHACINTRLVYSF